MRTCKSFLFSLVLDGPRNVVARGGVIFARLGVIVRRRRRQTQQHRHPEARQETHDGNQARAGASRQVQLVQNAIATTSATRIAHRMSVSSPKYRSTGLTGAGEPI